MNNYTKEQEENQELPRSGQNFEVKFNSDTDVKWIKAKKVNPDDDGEHKYFFEEDYTVESYLNYELTRGDVIFRQAKEICQYCKR